MSESKEDERYDSFDEYNYNKNLIRDVQGNLEGSDFNTFPNDVLSGIEENRQNVMRDCLRLKKYLISLNSKKTCLNNNCCVYINHWLNTIVRNSYKSNSNIFDIYNNYMNHESNSDVKILCSKLNYMTEDIYEKSKELHSIYEYYSNLKEYGKSFCNYAKKCAETYNVITRNSKKLKNIEYYNALKGFKDVFEKDKLISEKQCGEDIPNLYLPEYHYTSAQKELTITDLHPEEHADFSPGIGSFDEKTGVIKGEQEVQKNEQTPHLPTSLGSLIPVPLFSALVGIPVLLLTLYRFTPIGSWFLHRMRRGKYSLDNIDDETDNSGLPISEFQQEHFEKKDYNLSFYSLNN
ncbi:PIR Superfamily Protein [Plasmodium ovale wallikeri]|uniref:PIR Superfamily Protein n=2 Tax=Plasmodium ovale TaxID=36330 RepID=A0A1A9AIF0_PLAOA|nr:PIR Superfamily Protein [Plasmodium ovale wallikeri]SBT58826.1 PIR Superfamily Protein [Plasmodium ovale wallikeri]SBT73715.1 PIR protein [Plasmodium ovale]